MERTGNKEDADACILRVKCMLDGQYVEICPLKGAVIRFHWNACIDSLRKPGNFQELLAGEVTAGCPCWQRARSKCGKANQPGLRSCAPSFDLANHRARCDLPPPHEKCI